MVTTEEIKHHQSTFQKTINAVHEAFVLNPGKDSASQVFFKRLSTLSTEELACLSDLCQGYFSPRLMEQVDQDSEIVKSAIAKITKFKDQDSDDLFHGIMKTFNKLELIMFHQQILGQLQYKLASDIGSK